MKSLLKDTFREINNNKKRFISLLVIAFLGVGFYAGLRSTSVDMVNTLNDYYNDTLMYDYELISTYGITSDEIEYLNIDGVDLVEGSYSKDFLTKIDTEEVVSIIHSITKVNSLNLLDGAMPSSNNECVVEQNLLNDYNLSIGDTIEVLDSTDYLASSTLTISGVVESPLYISIDRGTSNLGSGSIDYYIYVDSSLYITDYYTEVYIRLDHSSDYDVGSNEYEEYLDSFDFESVVEYLSNLQYERVKNNIIDSVNEYYLNMGLDSTLIDYSPYLETLASPTWYVSTRLDNYGYSGFTRDSESIENIGKVFPLVFFIVAVLIALTSMTRMVEVERGNLGIYKALGYTPSKIALKYIIYASLATLIGGILGLLFGFTYIPRLIWLMYSTLYFMPYIETGFNVYFAVLSLGITYICIVGSTIFTAFSELKSVPATLLRPKAPKSGKRIFLERITVLWKRFKFSTKVTFRNLFRYKKRFFMTIIGIAGSTALVLAAFGIDDAVSDIVTNQYDVIFDYDLQVIVDSDELTDVLMNNSEVLSVVDAYVSTVNIVTNNDEWDVYLIVVSESDIEDIINLRDTDSKEDIVLDNDSFIISDKSADILGISIGDTILLDDTQVTVTGICENYISHYAYITKEKYEQLFDSEYNMNSLYIKTDNLTEGQIDELAKEILSYDSVLSLTKTYELETTMDETLQSLNYVIWILIISAGLLTFVVLYNLSNVNISERIRELATIKVLGFYDFEVYTYIAREMVILIAIGVLLGLGGGVLLTNYITYIAEVDAFRFGDVIHLSSYIYTIIITIGFNLIVDIFNYQSLKKIDMIESLKSVE